MLNSKSEFHPFTVPGHGVTEDGQHILVNLDPSKDRTKNRPILKPYLEINIEKRESVHWYRWDDFSIMVTCKLRNPSHPLTRPECCSP